MRGTPAGSPANMVCTQRCMAYVALFVIFRVKCLQKLALLLQKTVLREQAVFIAQRREQNALQHFGKRLLHIFAVERIRVRNAGWRQALKSGYRPHV